MATDNPALNFLEYMKGVGDAGVNIAKESAFGVYDFGQVAVGGAKILAKEGLGAAGLEEAAAKIVIEEIEPLSALGKVAATGGYAGLGNAVKDMPANVVNAVGSAVEKGDMRALGTAVTDAAMLAEGARVTAVGAGRKVAGAAKAAKAKLTPPPPASPATAAGPALDAAATPPVKASPVQQAKTAKAKAKAAGNPATSNSACPSCKKNNNVSTRAAKKKAAQEKAKAAEDAKRADKKAEEKSAADKMAERIAENEKLRASPQFAEDMAKVGVDDAQIARMWAKESPLGFKNPEQFQRFSSELDDMLAAQGLKDAEVGMKGTATTFYSENPGKRLGHHWDADMANPGDYDLNLTSKTMVERLQNNGISPSEKYGVFKTRDIQEHFPALDEFQARWTKELGRDVNFVGYPKPMPRDLTEYIIRSAK